MVDLFKNHIVGFLSHEVAHFYTEFPVHELEHDLTLLTPFSNRLGPVVQN